MANPSGNGSNNNESGDPIYHGGSSVTESVLQHNPGVSVDWTPDEQSILEDGLAKYATESNIIRYAKIAVQLQNKTVRDVAMRCRWMKRDNSNRRNGEYNLTRPTDRKEKMNEHLASTSRLTTENGPSSYFNGMAANGKSNALHSVLASPAGQLVRETAQALERVSANLETRQLQQLHENISLLCQVQKNIIEILSNFTDTPEVKVMPPFPVKLNQDLLNSLFSHARLQQMHMQMQ
uniref:uncharacterized protein LOC122600813 isoform X2 n=1 Tax=Erigeron canadensis TaxID=72917 RepID=UPI001CB89CC6|nr:uncharacterized protein LOC122600813 isoform X2 [Erigeron canadensis]